MKTTMGIIIAAFEKATPGSQFDKEWLLNYFKNQLKSERHDIESAYNAGKLDKTDCNGDKYYFMKYITND